MFFLTFFLPFFSLFIRSPLGLRRRLLLAGDGRPPLAASRPRVRVRALPAGRQSAAVTQPAVRTDLHQSLDVHLDVLLDIAHHSAFFIDDLADPGDLLLGEARDLDVALDLSPVKDLDGSTASNAEDVRQRDLDALV